MLFRRLVYSFYKLNSHGIVHLLRRVRSILTFSWRFRTAGESDELRHDIRMANGKMEGRKQVTFTSGINFDAATEPVLDDSLY
jgi:hypothetical protein